MDIEKANTGNVPNQKGAITKNAFIFFYDSTDLKYTKNGNRET